MKDQQIDRIRGLLQMASLSAIYPSGNRHLFGMKADHPALPRVDDFGRNFSAMLGHRELFKIKE